MRQLDKVQSFYESLHDINIVNLDLDDLREQLNFIIKDFNSEIQARSYDEKTIKQNKYLGSLLNDTLEKLRRSSALWSDNFESLLKREKFRSDLENYFIVIIYGKVKAGKSSLGNFIAKHNTLDSQAEFFKYDEAGNQKDINLLEELDEIDAFDTNNLECTTEIQGFKLDCLAWVDTPGLGSMVKENGELARQYIQSADFIIYPTSSNAPLQQDELFQIGELFAQKKPVTICITKSDTKEKQKDVSGKFKRDKNGKIARFLVNKAEQDRQEQEAYVRNEIKKVKEHGNHQLGSVISISAHAAQTGIDNNDENLFIGSNIPKFYDLLRVVAKEKASYLKQNTPISGLIAFIENELLEGGDGSIKALLSLLDYFDSQVKDYKSRFETIKQNTDSDIKNEIELIVSNSAALVDPNNAKEIFESIDKQLSESIGSLVDKNIKEILNGFNSSLIGIEKRLIDVSTFEINDGYKDIEVWYEDRSLLNILSFGLFGSEGSYVTETVFVGDNKEEMILSFKKSRQEAYTKTVVENYDAILKNFFIPISKVSNEMRVEINTLKSTILKYANNLQEGL